MFRKILRFVGWTFFVITVLLIAVALLVRVPAIQNRIAQKAIAYLEKKIGTNVELERIVINFPKKVVIEGLYLEDLQKDTLFYAGRIGVDASMLKLFRSEIELSQVEISNATANVIRTLPDSAFNFDYIVEAFASSDTTVELPADTTRSSWKFSLGDIELEKVKFLYDDSVGGMNVAGNVGTLEVDTDQIDPVNLLVSLDKLDLTNTSIAYGEYSLSEINLSVSDLKVDTTNIEGEFEKFSFKEKNGIALEKLEGKLKLNKKEAEVSSLELLAGDTHLFVDGKANLVDSTGELSIAKSQISIDDILKFKPDLLDSLPVKVPQGMIVSIEAKGSGGIQNVTVESLEIQTLDSTSLSLTGTADLKTSTLDATLKKFYTTMSDARKILPDSLFPDSLDLPHWADIEGKLSGSLKQPVIASTLKTDKGTIVADGKFNLGSEIPAYQARVTARSLKAGDLAGQPALGDINFDLAVDGRGFTTKDLQTKVDLAIQDITYNEYTFRNFKVNGRIDKFLFSGKASLDDENLKFVLDGDLDYNGDIPVYKAQFDLENIDFQKLKFTERPLRARLTVDVDLTTNDFKIMNGRLDIRKVGVYNGEKLYSVDSMLFASLDQEGHSTMSIRS
ncbi:MAG TPA: AsmA family protein, partial [Cyclobacteriaceae bacterium]|nr:AsmA family protein [Cyclobacteriaceae bacterium]